MASVAQELIEQIAAYDITPKELGFSVGKTGQAKPGRKSLGARIAQSGKVHTRPDGQTYTEGTRGRKPQWVKDTFLKNASGFETSSSKF